MPIGYDIWGVVAGVIGTVGLIPALYQLLAAQFPSAKLAYLPSEWDATETLWRSVIEDGLLIEADYVRKTEEQLNK